MAAGESFGSLASFSPGAECVEQVGRLIHAGAAAVGHAGHEVEAEERLRFFQAAEVLHHALVVVDGRLWWHHGVRRAGGGEELAASFFKSGEVGVLRIQIRREGGGVGVEVCAEVDFLQLLLFAEDPLPQIQVSVRC